MSEGSALPTCPEHLSEVAKAEWGRMVGVFHEHGLLTEVDRAALADYCEAYAQWVKAANAEIAASAAQARAASDMRELADELGMLPREPPRGAGVGVEPITCVPPAGPAEEGGE